MSVERYYRLRLEDVPRWPHLVCFVSQVMTLRPGDIISTGTPSGVGPLRPGDVAEVEIEDVGTLGIPSWRVRERT